MIEACLIGHTHPMVLGAKYSCFPDTTILETIDYFNHACLQFGPTLPQIGRTNVAVKLY